MSVSKHYICCTCGTKHQNDKHGYCANGHDDWMQFDEILYLTYGNSVDVYKGYEKEILKDQLNRLQQALNDLYNTIYSAQQIIEIFQFFTL
jgi:hypothetical protein